MTQTSTPNKFLVYNPSSLFGDWLEGGCYYYCNKCYYCVTVQLGSLLESETVVERQLRMSGQQGPIQGHGATVTNKQMKKQNSKKNRVKIFASVIHALLLEASQYDLQKKMGFVVFDNRPFAENPQNHIFF